MTLSGKTPIYRVYSPLKEQPGRLVLLAVSQEEHARRPPRSLILPSWGANARISVGDSKLPVPVCRLDFNLGVGGWGCFNQMRDLGLGSSRGNFRELQVGTLDIFPDTLRPSPVTV